MFPTAIVLLALAAPPASAQAPAEALAQAKKFYDADRFGEAEPLFKVALRAGDASVTREAYNGLLNLYVRSGRFDKAIVEAERFRTWMKEVGDADLALVELLEGQCRFHLGYDALADERLLAAISAKPPLPPAGRLEAMRLRAEVAVHQQKPGEARARWVELEKAAEQVAKDANRASDALARIEAVRYQVVATFRRGDADGALALLAEFPAWHDRINDPLGRRDTQRQRANLLAVKGKYAEAASLFEEALKIHRKERPRQRMLAGDILAEWSVAAVDAKQLNDAARLRAEAAAEYRAAIDSPAENYDAGGPLAAFIQLQSLTRGARQFREALQVSLNAGERWSGDPLVDARLKSDRGGLELMTSAYRTAKESLTVALKDLDAAKPPNLRALPKVLVNLATAELACDTPEKADELLARCERLYRDQTDLPPDAVLVECDYLAGVAASRRGDFAQAMARFRAGLALSEAVGKSADGVRFNLLVNTAIIYREQGEEGLAGDELKKAADLLATFPEPDDLLAALIGAVRADMLLNRGRIAEAMKLVPSIEAACEKHNAREGYLWETARHTRAVELLVNKDILASEKVWAELAEAQKKSGSVLYPRTLNFLGVCADLSGRTPDAIKLFEEARAFQGERPRCPPRTRAITLWRLAVLTDRAGKGAEAKKLLGEVFDVADEARLKTFGGAAQRADYFADFLPAFELLAAWCARDGDGEGLLRVAVRSRSRTLLDQIMATGADPRERLTGDLRKTLLAREAAARQAVSQLRAQAMLIPAVAEGVKDAAAEKVMKDLADAQDEYTAVWREIANADPRTRDIADPAFAEKSIKQVREEAHKSGGALLTYFVGRDASFAVLCTDPAAAPLVFPLSVSKAVAEDIGDLPKGDAVAGAGVRGLVYKPLAKQPDRPAAPQGELVPLTKDVAARLVNQYLRQISNPEFNPTRGLVYVARAKQESRVGVPEVLGDAVLPRALRQRLRSLNAKRLVLVPDGALHKLPFECLLLSSSPNPAYAIDELPPVCYAPSVAVLAEVLKRPMPAGDATLLTVGDPAYPEAKGKTTTAIPRLPYTAVESEKVRQFFPANRVTALLKADATEAKVAAALPGKQFVHLAAHGFADESFGNAFAAIILAPPPGAPEPGDDGFLTLHEISRLNLAGCELTVLSACVTNVGPQRPMEAGVTLAGAFLGAGSRGVMASCWSVDDRATAELMSGFFKEIRPANGKPLSYPDAMKKVRLAVRGTPGWEAPFFWAPFVYLGPPD